MISDPGSKLDFGTFIAYIIPGYILEFFLFGLTDSISILTIRTSLLSRVAWSAVEIAIIGASVTVLAYPLGLLLDTIAHPLTLQNELQMKGVAYKTAVNQFRGFIKNREINNLLYSSDSDVADIAKRDLFIDSMFYRLATSEIWARQNWHWAFYEFSRQMYLLCVPLIVVGVFYATLVSILINDPIFEPLTAFGVSLGVTILVSIVNWFTVRPLLKKARDTDCVVYYRHRAWILLAYLIEKELVAQSLARDESKLEKGN